MPIYEYTCKACSARFEKLVKSMNGQAKAACPKCGSGKTERMLSVFAVKAEASPSSGASAHAPGCACCAGRSTCPAAQE